MPGRSARALDPERFELPRRRLPRVADFDAVEAGVESGLRQATAKGIHTRLSPVFKTPAELEIGSPLLLDMVEDARILFDRDATLQGRLYRLRAPRRAEGAPDS